MSEFRSLLPSNVHPETVALERAISRAFDLPVEVIATLWNPVTCPAAVLPWLAWSMSVDEWRPEWDEATKRAVIAESIKLHLTKGTRGSIQRLLELIGFPGAAITEWWEPVTDPVLSQIHSTDPYTFSIGFDPQCNPIPFDPALFSRLSRLLAHNVPVRSRWCLYLNVHSSSTVGVGGAARLMQFARFTGVDDPGITATQALGLGSAASLMQFARFVYRPLPAWGLMLDYTDAADPAPWALTLDYTDAADPAPWLLTLDYADHADVAPWVLTLDYSDGADVQPWTLTLDYTDAADPAPGVLTIDYTDQAEV